MFSIQYKKTAVLSAYKYSFYTKAITQDELKAIAEEPEKDKNGHEITVMHVVEKMNKNFTKVQVTITKLREAVGAHLESELRENEDSGEENPFDTHNKSFRSSSMIHATKK